MTQEELNKLAEHGYVTDVTLLRACIENPTLLNALNFNNFVSQTISPIDSAEEKAERGEIVSEEWFLAELAKGYVKMTGDVQLTDTAIVKNKVTVDLNGHVVTSGVFGYDNGKVVAGNTDSYGFWVKKGGNLTLIDETNNGGIKTQSAEYSMNIWAEGGTVTINSGRYVNAGEGSDLIYASAGGKIFIYGGEFFPCGKEENVPGTLDKYTALNIKDADAKTSKIEVYGGIFHNFNPANNQSEGKNTSYVAEGYESVEIRENVWEVRKIEDSPVIVEEA